MKRTDDYRAKIRMWVEELRVVPAPPPPRLPSFPPQRFRSHEEMNAWKKELLRRLAREIAQDG